MKKIYALLLLLTLACAPLLAEGTAHIFAWFKHRAQDGLHIAYSPDGLKWTDLNGGKPVFNPADSVPQTIFRDPSIIQGPDGTFHLVYTSDGYSKRFGYSHSTDLVHWSTPQLIEIMDTEPDAINVWAPELFYNEEDGNFYIFWSSTIPGRYKFYSCNDGNTTLNNRIYYTTTRDFRTFEPAQIYFNPRFQVIDAAVIRDPVRKDYIMVLKNENRDEKNIRMVRSKNLRKGFSKRVSKPITEASYAAEGPSPLWVGDTLIVYFDKFREGRYGAVRSLDRGKHWEDISDQTSFPVNFSHGTALTIDRDLLLTLFPELR